MPRHFRHTPAYALQRMLIRCCYASMLRCPLPMIRARLADARRLRRHVTYMPIEISACLCYADELRDALRCVSRFDRFAVALC